MTKPGFFPSHHTRLNGFRHSLWSLFGLLIMGIVVQSAWATGISQQATDAVELQALFEVLNGINSDVDWKATLPDPCLGNQQGVYCLADDVSGTYHVTNLEFGFLSEYDTLVSCSQNASLHPSISLLPFLQTLFIYNCFTNGTEATIPKEIGRLSSSLQMLTLHGNPALGGVLPAEIGNLTSLQRLVLTENSIGGVIPSEIGGLRGLLELDLSENQIQGALPDSLNFLSSLVILDLGYNFFSGDLPSLGGLSELQQLILSRNNLSGSIPDSFGNLSSLTYLDLSRNNLSGDIPSSFVNLIKLQDLFLNNNSMQSSLPEFVGNMHGLVRLSLSESGYTGELPSSLGKLANLRVLLLNGNNFSGRIPVTLGELPEIYQLDLSDNHLTGLVPFPSALVAKLGTNLVLADNAGLCVLPSTLREVVGLLGVSICDEGDNLENSSLEAGAPSNAAALGPGQMEASDASKLSLEIPSRVVFVIAFSAFAVCHWMATCDQFDSSPNARSELEVDSGFRDDRGGIWQRWINSAHSSLHVQYTWRPSFENLQIYQEGNGSRRSSLRVL